MAEEVTKRRPRRGLLPGAVVALVAAAVFAGWSGVSWLRVTGDDALAYATARDQALTAGREHIAVLSSLDYRRVNEGIERWLSVTTGGLREELAGTEESTKNSLREGQTVSTGRVLDAAVSEVDPRGGTAKLLASVEITTVERGTELPPKRYRFAAQLIRTGDGWKLSALDQVPIGEEGTP